MPWKAFKRVLEMQGIVLGLEDSQKLFRLIQVKGDAEMINYKQALQYISPNMEADEPLRAPWTMRKAGGAQADFLSKVGSSRLSQASASPSKLSMHSLNNP